MRLPYTWRDSDDRRDPEAAARPRILNFPPWLDVLTQVSGSMSCPCWHALAGGTGLFSLGYGMSFRSSAFTGAA
jgi:hypothetical protein